MVVAVDAYPTKSTHIQVVVSVLANTGLFLSGMVLGFPSALLGPLVDSHGPGFHASINDGSWIASIAHISSPLGCLVGGPLVDRLGRRRGLLIVNIPNVVGWLLLALVPFPFQSIYPLIVGRMLTGFAAGLASPASATYVAEVVAPRLRTKLVTLPSVMMGFGIFVSYLLADIFQHQWLIAACLGVAVSIISTILTPFLPESPLWLLSRNCKEKAFHNLMALRSTTCHEVVQEEFNKMIDNLSSANAKPTWRTTLHNMSKPEAYKPLLIMITFFFFQQISGVSVIIVYGVEFARDAGIPKAAYTVALFIGVIRMVSTFITGWACNRWGRRKPAIYTTLVTALSLIILAVYASLRRSHPDTVPATTWIPATCIFIIILSSSIGLSTLPWSMLGEIFPTTVRGVNGGITTCFGYTMAFIGVKFYPILVPVVGSIAVFLFFGISALVGAVYLMMFLPETHGKTLKEIEEYFKGSKASKESETGMDY